MRLFSSLLIVCHLAHLSTQRVVSNIVKGEYNFTEPCSDYLMVNGVGFNPFPGDCAKYVKCWVDNQKQEMVSVRNCPFGQFWDSEAITCRPSRNVQCSEDPCNNAPNGFTYGMPLYGCRSYWACINEVSVGSCCSQETYYVEGMGCMRGSACKTLCPPDEV